jgi:hypothetical protein
LNFLGTKFYPKMCSICFILLSCEDIKFLRFQTSKNNLAKFLQRDDLSFFLSFSEKCRDYLADLISFLMFLFPSLGAMTHSHRARWERNYKENN